MSVCHRRQFLSICLDNFKNQDWESLDAKGGYVSLGFESENEMADCKSMAKGRVTLMSNLILLGIREC